MKFMKSLLALPVLLFVTGCDPVLKHDTTLKPRFEYYAKRMQDQLPSSRFEVTIADSFDDGFAYNNRRAIYVITDKTTGREYIGISGVGIAEVGSHDDGENSVEDER